MSGMSGGSMLRARRKDTSTKPNRKLDRKSSRGMLYENEELRLRTININAEVEKGQTDIKKLKKENELLRREILALRYEYDRLDTLLRERSSSPHSDDSGRSCCSACRQCDPDQPDERPREQSAGLHVAFHDLCVVPEEETIDTNKIAEIPDCGCDTCKDNQDNNKERINQRTLESNKETAQETNNIVNNEVLNPIRPKLVNPAQIQELPTEKTTVDVLLHDSPTSYLVTSIVSPPPPGFHVPPPPLPGFALPYDPQPRFHTGGNIEDLLGEVEMGQNINSTEFIEQKSIFMCNTTKIIHRREPCKCQKQDERKENEEKEPKCYVTKKNIELNYDYPRAVEVLPNQSPQAAETTEEVNTVVILERRYPVKPKSKFDMFFRSQSAPVGENDEPIYATVKKLPKRLRKLELANLEKEVAYRNGDAVRETSQTDRTDTEESLPLHDEDASRSDADKQPPAKRPDTPKAKKRRRFSFTFKKRGERKKKLEKEKQKEVKNGTQPVNESDSERLIEGVDNGVSVRHPRRCRHVRPRTVASSVSSGPRYKRDSYQEMTSHSEHERTNSISSSVNSNCSLATHKRKLSAPPPDTSIPWCGCWGTSCL